MSRRSASTAPTIMGISSPAMSEVQFSARKNYNKGHEDSNRAVIKGVIKNCHHRDTAEGDYSTSDVGKIFHLNQPIFMVRPSLMRWWATY